MPEKKRGFQGLEERIRELQAEDEKRDRQARDEKEEAPRGEPGGGKAGEREQ